MLTTELPLLLAPFALTQLLYWTFYIPVSQPSFLALVLKCLPVLSLIAYTYKRRGPRQHLPLPRRILLGLSFSVLGDAFLVFEDVDVAFSLGMLSFGTAHAFYISAFGWERTKPGLLVPLVAYGAAILYVVLPGIDDPVIKYAMPVYGLLLLTCSWRALARVSGPLSGLTAVGTLLFVASDSTLAWGKFVAPLEFGQQFCMTAYYSAQLLIALSAAEAIAAEASSGQGKSKTSTGRKKIK